jgi:hypothetical protein
VHASHVRVRFVKTWAQWRSGETCLLPLELAKQARELGVAVRAER